MNFKDLTGKKFGRLTVVERAPDHIQSNGRRRIMWRCICDCGAETIVHGDNLKAGKVQSCKCMAIERMHEQFATHHQSDTKLYNVWCSIKRRCYNPNSAYYEDYGGRGISMCDNWRNSFEEFALWANQSGYNDGLSIDRIDYNGDYGPSNCRWVTAKEQANNRRSNILISFNGETHNIKQWSEITSIPYSKLHQRYRAGWGAERMLTTA